MSEMYSVHIFTMYFDKLMMHIYLLSACIQYAYTITQTRNYINKYTAQNTD